MRGDHSVHEIKLGKLAALAEYRMATEAEILEHLGTEPGFIGPIGANKPITVIADRSVAAMSDFVVGANEKGFHIAGVNWGRDLPEPDLIADIRSVIEGDPSPRAPSAAGRLFEVPPPPRWRRRTSAARRPRGAIRATSPP